MSQDDGRRGPVGLDAHGITNVGRVPGTPRSPRSTSTRWPRATAPSPRAAPLVVSTGAHTGRAPKDKFVVREPGSEDRVWWGADQPAHRAEAYDDGSRGPPARATSSAAATST